MTHLPYNQEYILNNSSMKNAINYSRGTPCFFFSVILPFDTDLDYVAKLTLDARERFVKATRGKLTGGFWMHGVWDFKNYGMEVGFIGLVAEPMDAYRGPAQCRTEMIKLLRENGIEPAEAFERTHR